MVTSREIRLKSRPIGMPSAENFDLATVTVPDPAPGEVQVKNIWMTVDPYMRGRMVDRASYVPPFQLGEPLQGGAIGEVAASNDPRLKRGDLVSTMFGWRKSFNAPAANLQKLDTFGCRPDVSGDCRHARPDGMGGLLKVAALKPGDVVFVSAAAGAVGSVVCQIAKIKGHRVIGSAGGAVKGAFLKQIGVDHVIDYKATGNLTKALLPAAPNEIDVYFDNVGGEHLEAALTAANRFARFALCGMISQSGCRMPAGPRNIMFAIGKSIRLEGFIVANHFNLLPEFQKDMSGWIRDGKVTWKETVEHGIENAPTAFLKLFKGENLGKMLVKLV